MEGKEVRFGITNSACGPTATTAASNGSVNAMHDSFTPLGGLAPMWLMQLGEIVFGGVGSGLYGMLVYAIIAVFIAGLMVGRTPEYLGKKIEAYEMKMASLVILLPRPRAARDRARLCAAGGHGGAGQPRRARLQRDPLRVLVGREQQRLGVRRTHRERTVLRDVALGLCMLVGRYWVIVPVLALAGALARKKGVPVSAGTLPTHTPLFVGLLVGTIVCSSAR
jgi:K+-transporting ATPase ATPase A chain